MNHKQIADYWDKNAVAWQEASEKGFDVWRDSLNTPAFLKMLPDLTDLSGLDIGCGEGYNSRLIAKRCQSLTAIDISEKFLALNQTRENPHNISYKKMNATELSFPNEYFDFVVSTMSFMDLTDLETALAEIYRVLTPTGFLQFSIIHPCFNDQKGQWLKDENGHRISFAMKDYFKETQGDIHEWRHYNAPKNMAKFAVPRFWKPLNKWLNLLIKAGFMLDEVCEPSADDQALSKHPELISTRIVPHSLIIRVKKNDTLNQPLRAIIEKLPGNVWWKNTNLVYLGCNDHVIKILGLNSRKDFISKTDHDLWEKSIADKLREADLHVLKTGENISLEEVIIEKDGSQVIMLTNKSPFYDNDHHIIGIVGTSTDITERKKIEESLRIAKEEAEVANKMKTEFMHNMEHDIRTPFNGIWTLANLLESQEQDKEKKELLNDVSNCAKELLDYCNNILDFAKTEAGVVPILFKKFDLKMLLNKIITLEIPPVKSKHLQLLTDYSEDLPHIVMGDQYRIERILLNIASNAVKFTKEGYVKISAKLMKKFKNKNIVVRLIVEDTGIGIPADKQNFIYEKFTRGTPANQGIYKGSGLGLRVVKQLIEEINGEIDVKSELGKGTTFTCTIPLKLPLVDDVTEG